MGVVTDINRVDTTNIHEALSIQVYHFKPFAMNSQ